jgi:putative salt-induced outer membrane protein YdiY
MLANDEFIWARVIRNTNETTTTVELEPDEPPRNYAPSELAYINPAPWRDGEGYKFSGRVNLAFERERGNTDKDELDLDGDLEWRWKSDRVTALGELERDENNNRRTKLKWDAAAQYDHFFTKKWYYGGVVQLEVDKNADLNLRSRFGPLLGYQWFESRDLNLSTQAGPMRVREDFDNEADNNYWAAGWVVDFDKFLFADIMQFYHRHWGVWNVEETDDVVMDSWTGLRFPLLAGFVASTELRAEYDSGAAKGKDELDTTFKFKLGYEW